MAEDENSESIDDVAVLLGQITVNVFLDEEGNLIYDADVTGLDTHQAVGILEAVKFDQLFWPTEKEDD